MEEVKTSELQELRAKAEAYHNDKERAEQKNVKKGYFESLFGSPIEKAKFRAIYQEMYPEDTETIEGLDASLENDAKKKENYKGFPLAIIIQDLGELYKRAFKLFLENLKPKEKKDELKNKPKVKDENKSTGTKMASYTNIDYDQSWKPGKEKKSKRKTARFGRKNKETLKDIQEQSNKQSKQTAEQKAREDARLARYNEDVKQRGLESERSQSWQMSNDRVMGK